MTVVPWDRERLLRLCPENPQARPGSGQHSRRLTGRVRTAAGELAVSQTATGRYERWGVGPVPVLTAEQCCRLLDLVRAVEAAAGGAA